jgi:hypothetical protein
MKFMNRKALFFLLFACTVLISACSIFHHGKKQQVRIKGTWQSKPIVIDGKNEDWPSPYPSYDSKSMVGYATSNDSTYLYVTVETGDEYTQMKILKQGLTLYIDTDGGKDTYMGIHYPLQNENETSELDGGKDKMQRVNGADARGGQGRSMTQRIKKGFSEANQLTLEGFKGCNGGFLVKEKNSCGITVRMDYDEYKTLIWEAAIPFKAIYNREKIRPRDLGRPLSVGIYIKAFKKPNNETNGNQQGGMGRGGGMGSMGGGGMRGMGGMGGGGMRGGSRGGGNYNSNNPREHLFESTRTWTSIGIALQ